MPFQEVRGVWAGQKAQRESQWILGQRCNHSSVVQTLKGDGTLARGSEEFKGMSTVFLNYENRKLVQANENKEKETKRGRLWKLV